MGLSSKPEVSVIVPAYNEVDNIGPLLAELSARFPSTYEVIIVDDGSRDGTYEAALAEQAKYPFVRVARHPTNQGKTAAIVTGMELARADIISILDADLQFLPEDVMAQVQKLEEGYGMVTGRKRGHYEKRLVSAIYNGLARLLFGLKVHDINALKTFRREALDGVVLRKDWHRYIVPLAASRGVRIAEIPVTLRPRHAGEAKYSNPLRVFIGLFDLVAVAFQLSFMRKPMLYFGTLGMLSLVGGFIAGVVAVILRLFGHGFRPLLYLVVLLVLAGLLLFAAGFLGEALAGINERVERLERLLTKAKDRGQTEGGN